MAINEKTVKPGRYFATKSHQLRKVTKLTKDNQGRTRVEYLAKSIRIRNRKFHQAGTMANPALLKTFAKACARQLSLSEVKALRVRGILLKGE